MAAREPRLVCRPAMEPVLIRVASALTRLMERADTLLLRQEDHNLRLTAVYRPLAPAVTRPAGRQDKVTAPRFTVQQSVEPAVQRRPLVLALLAGMEQALPRNSLLTSLVRRHHLEAVRRATHRRRPRLVVLRLAAPTMDMLARRVAQAALAPAHLRTPPRETIDRVLMEHLPVVRRPAAHPDRQAQAAMEQGQEIAVVQVASTDHLLMVHHPTAVRSAVAPAAADQ